MRSAVANYASDLAAFILLLLFLYLFFFVGAGGDEWELPKQWAVVNTMFLGIILEAIPFILIGVFVSAFIQSFISERTLRRWIPQNPLLAISMSACLGILFPVCECAIIPIVRRLIRKGMPPAAGIAFLLSAPIVNPVVFLSTYYAFQSKSGMAFARIGLAVFIAIVVALILYRLFRNENPLKATMGTEDHAHAGGKWKAMLHHAGDEFFDTGKYLFIGAFLASCVQAFFDRSVLLEIGGNEWGSPLLMMGFAYVLSLCSEADAFIAASFSHTFSAGAILAFLIYGPMLDLKNTFMLFAYFRAKFVFYLALVLTGTVYLVVLLYQIYAAA